MYTHTACVYSQLLSRVQLFATAWSVTYQVPLSMGFSRQEYRSVLPRPPPGDLPDPRIKPISLRPPALAGGSLPLVPWYARLLPELNSQKKQDRAPKSKKRLLN